MMATHWIMGITSVMFLIAAQEFGGTVMMTISLKLVIYQKVFIIERLTNPLKMKNILMHGSTKVLFVVYIRTSHLTKHSYNVFEEFKIMSKSTLMKKVIDEQNVFRSEVMVRKEVNDEIKRSISYIKDELQISIERNVLERRKRKNHFGCMVMD